MKIGINAVALYPNKIGGAEQYLRNIVRELLRHDDLETYLFLQESAMDTFEKHPKLHLVKISMDDKQENQLKGYIELYMIDVWFCPFFHLIPVDCSIPNVTTIFDIQQDFFPENFDKIVLRNRKFLTQETIKHAQKLLTISEYSKKTIVEKYSADPADIKVTYLDADDSFNRPIDPDKLAKIKEKLPENFILYSANMWPHKNHIALIKAFAKVKREYKLPLKLVFTGAQERETDQIKKAIADNHLRDDVKYLGYLPQDDVRYVFKCANMVAFPSLFEGFGIPLVEAMASEVPVICSTSSCIPEIVGDAGYLFDGNNVDEIAQAIYKVFTDQELREKLVANGIKRRPMFSWQKCAEETIDYLKSVYVPRKPLPQKLSDHPLVTVITPSYNQGEFIRETIESVLNQTYDNIEYIVMDGGSTDNTVEILKSYGDRIKWFSEKDGGQADAVNKGIRIANGEIIGWLNSDDTYYPDAIEKAVELLKLHPDADMIYGEGDYIDRDSKVTGRYETLAFDYQELAKQCPICQPAAFFTKEIVEKVGLLRADLQLCMDYELWMRIGAVGKILYTPDVLATSRMYEDNKTLSRRSEVYKECCQEVKRHYGYVPHRWLEGYAIHQKSLHPRGKMKIFYALLFLKYNYNRMGYLVECYRKWRMKR